MNRRRFLTLGVGASGTLALGGGARTGGRPAAARPSTPPTVDRLVLTNVVDNLYDVFARDGRLDTVTLERTPLGSTTLLAEHGLAYHIECTRGGERRQILLDFGLTDVSLFNNYRALRIDPFAADALILSHGHLDHYGALSALASVGLGKLKPGLTLFAGGEDTFCHRVVVTPAATVDQGHLDRPALEARGLAVMLARQPTVVAGQAFTSGPIPRLTDFEKPPAAAWNRAAADSACSATHFGLVQVEATPGDLVSDNFQDEHATAFNVKDRGLVVITSCGHAGVINSVRQVQRATSIEKVHAIVGGFHLAPAPEETVARTVAAFKAINPDYIIPAHCTGLNTIMAVHREMPSKLIKPSTGTRVVFGA